jgi:hypothetical protein
MMEREPFRRANTFSAGTARPKPSRSTLGLIAAASIISGVPAAVLHLDLQHAARDLCKMSPDRC